MGFADAGRAHQHQSFFAASRKFVDKFFGEKFRGFQGRSVLWNFTNVSAVAFEVAMLVAFGDARAIHHARGAIFHAAVASRGHGSGAIRTRDHLPSCAAAELAVLESHRKKAYGCDARTASRGECGFVWMNRLPN